MVSESRLVSRTKLSTKARDQVCAPDTLWLTLTGKPTRSSLITSGNDTVLYTVSDEYRKTSAPRNTLTIGRSHSLIAWQNPMTFR